MTVKGQSWPSDLDNYDDGDDDDDENTDYEEFDMLQTCWIMISVLRPWSGWKVLPAALETIPVDDIVRYTVLLMMIVMFAPQDWCCHEAAQNQACKKS